jgi:hypothetical protein
MGSKWRYQLQVLGYFPSLSYYILEACYLVMLPLTNFLQLIGFLWRTLMLPTNGLTVIDPNDLEMKHFPSSTIENEMEV